ncbi:siderophore-interacting protein [Tistrella mobilis]|uniref:Siderophore-interacting protein n=1 Tax=Tistrella mobilis TaxID=171437 RepID=A0A162KEE2_9PROT|nr:siderophore-interacting protein [Tistrella mobilis]KYO51072.1 siderophore-interacting protein [Tistrella mobilis]
MPRFKAEAEIAFAGLDRYFDTIIASLSAHNMTLRAEGNDHVVEAGFSRARLMPGQGVLRLLVEASDPAAFNRLKHELTGLIDFVARPEGLQIAWTGDTVGAALPQDLRVLTVRTVAQLTPRMRRITFAGRDLGRYAVPDQIHCRLLFQEKGVTAPRWPELDDHGRILWPDSGVLPSRIFTIRRIDAAAGLLDIDFVLHDGAGPGAAWARDAAPGDVVGILGPAANGPKPAGWYLLAGDETGLPGMARILEGLPAAVEGVALIEVADAAEEQAIAAPPGVQIRWLHRGAAAPGTTSLLIDALRQVAVPADHGGIFAWIGAEYTAFREMRGFLKAELGIPADRMIAFSHWRRGMSEADIVAAGIASVSA